MNTGREADGIFLDTLFEFFAVELGDAGGVFLFGVGVLEHGGGAVFGEPVGEGGVASDFHAPELGELPGVEVGGSTWMWG